MDRSPITLFYFILSMVFSLPAFSVDFDFKSKGLTASLQFSGSESWDYEVSISGGRFSIKVPKLSASGVKNLKELKSNLVKIDKIDQSSERFDVIIVSSNTQTQTLDSFDYLLQRPSRLVVDFFPKEGSDTKVTTSKKPISKTTASKPISKATQNTSTDARSPAAAEVLQILDSAVELAEKVNEESSSGGQVGLQDAADVHFTRLQVPKSELRSDPELYYYLGDYIDYPFLPERLRSLDKMKANMPVYQVQEEDPEGLRSDEKQNAKLLVKLFDNERYVVFLRTADWFTKKYPDTPYEEMIRSMWADAHYKLYLTDPVKLRNHLNLARARFEELIEKFPNSPLVERTLLFMSYSSIEDKDFISALRWFQRHVSTFPQSLVVNEAKLGVARSLIGASQYSDAKKQIDQIVKVDCKLDKACQVKALLLEADMHIAQNQWGQAQVVFERIESQFPEAQKAEERFFYNYALVLFRKMDFQKSLDTFLSFIKRYPTDPYAGYALTRMGEIIDIISTNPNRALGAYLEAYFRYGVGTGSTALFARIRLLEKQLSALKGRAQAAAIKEIQELAVKSGLPQSSDFANFIIANSLREQKEYDRAMSYLLPAYRDDPTHVFADKYLEKITEIQSKKLISDLNQDPLTGLQKHEDLTKEWLRDVNRMDVNYSIGNGFLKLGAFDKARQYYSKVVNQIDQLDSKKIADRLAIYFQSPPTKSDLAMGIIESLMKAEQWNEAYDQIQKLDQSGYILSGDQKIQRAAYLAQLLNRKGQQGHALRYIRDMRTIASESANKDPALLADEIRALKSVGDHKSILAMDKQVELACKDRSLYQDTCYQSERSILEAAKKSQTQESYQARLQAFIENYEPYFNLDDLRYELGQMHLKNGSTDSASAIWSKFKNPNSGWAKLAKSDLEGAKFENTYKNYFDQIPALARDPSQVEGGTRE